MSDQTILPIGFYDLYGTKAEKHFSIISNILNYLKKEEFELFIPTALEFPHNSSDKSHNSTNAKPFSVHDPLSEDLLTIRDDITPQITRALHYSKSKTPRICYFGDIYRSNISSSEQKRKFTQVGFEIISDDKDKIIKECFTQLLALLTEISLQNYKIIITLPTLFQNIKEELAISKDQDESFARDVNEVNLTSLQDNYKINRPIQDFLTGLNLKQDNLNYLTSHLPKSTSSSLLILQDLLEIIPDTIAKHVICNFRHDTYHNNIAFAVISSNSNATYARGGDYKINKKYGCGVSFYVEEILNSDSKK